MTPADLSDVLAGDDVVRRQERVPLDPPAYDRVRARAEDRTEAAEGPPPTVGAAVSNADGETLLVRTEGRDGWILPVGGVADGRPLAAAAATLVRDRTGVEASIERVAEVVDRVFVRNGEGSTERFAEPLILFVGRTADRPEPSPGDGVVEADWFGSVPEDVLRPARLDRYVNE